MSEVVKAIDKLRLMMLVQNYTHAKSEIKRYTDRARDAFQEINDEFKPEIEIGKKYLCIEHSNDIMAYAQFAPTFYANQLKENKLCLYFQHSAFKNKYCKLISIKLDGINTNQKVLYWILNVENEDKNLFQCRYATRYVFEEYPKINLDDLATMLMSVSKTPLDVDLDKVLLAVNHKGDFSFYIDKVPNDWIYTGKPVLPKDVDTWAKFITHPDSMMEAPNSQLLTINEWLNYCNRQKVSVV